MGLFTHLFGNKKTIAKELVMDDSRRLTLWQEHLGNYHKRESLAKHFSYGDVDRAIQDFSTTQSVLAHIESLIAPDLINISGEEKLDEEVIADLHRLKGRGDIARAAQSLMHDKTSRASFHAIFQAIHDALKSELHLIRLIRARPANIKDLLLHLFGLINNTEADLYRPFLPQSYSDRNKETHTKLVHLAKLVILEEEFQDEIETDEERFANEMARRMDPDESRRTYRNLGESIYHALAEMAGLDLETGENFLEGLDRLHTLMNDDRILHSVIIKLRKRYDDQRVRATIIAFRKAYDLGHFWNLEPEYKS